MFSLSIILLISIFVLIYLYIKKVVYSYWKNHGVPHDKPTLLIGTLQKEFFQKKITFGMHVKQRYDKFKTYPFHGEYMLLTPILFINDPELIKDILIKNFQYFPDRGTYHNVKIDPLTANLFFLPGDRWKVLRAKFSSTFTPNKMKNMFCHLTEIADDVITVSNENLLNSDIVDLKNFISRYTTDTICSLFFGFNPHSLRDENCAFRYHGALAIENRPLTNALGFFAPQVLDFFRTPFLNRKASKFFIKLFKDVIIERRNAGKKRNDFLDLMIELMDTKQEIEEDSYNKSILDGNIKELASKPLTLMEATAQAFVFYIAGFETSSTTAAYMLHEISENRDIQTKLHHEIDEFYESSKEFSIENIMKLEYLDMVFNETTRKHVLVPFLNRICVKDYKIPNSNYCIPKGMKIIIPVHGLHRNPDIYPDPEKFDPTRFNKTNTAARHPCHFLPFGVGPRYCIGKRLGILQSKFIVFVLLSKYEFSVCEKTEPIKYSRESIIHTPEGAIYLRMQKRKNVK